MGDAPEGEAVSDNKPEDLKRVRDMIEYLDDQVARGREMGVEFSEVEGLLQGARMMLDSGAVQDARELAVQATEMASQRFTEFGLLQNNIKKLEAKIQAATLGDDISEARKNLKMAKYHQNTGYYRLGNDYATRGLKLFTEKKEVEFSWGSGL